jgi:hypothetical protein
MFYRRVNALPTPFLTRCDRGARPPVAGVAGLAWAPPSHRVAAVWKVILVAASIVVGMVLHVASKLCVV